MYKFRMGCWPNLKKPKSFTEKIQWIKLHDRKAIYSKMADKIEARKIIEEKIGKKYLIPLIKIYKNADEIDFDELPDQFVLKCNHDSKSKFICKDKKTTDLESARKLLKKKIKSNYYYYFREWSYKNIDRRIICEKYMEDSVTGELRDYRFYCFNGKVRVIGVDYDIIRAYKRCLLTPDWTYINVRYKHLKGKDGDIKKPEQLDTMLKLAEILAKDMYFLRVDFFIANGRLYSGELTLYPSGGYSKFDPPEYDYELGSYLKLPIDD